MENQDEQFRSINEEVNSLDQPHEGQSIGFFKQLFRDAITLLTEPRLFFNERFENMTQSQAIALGLFTAWLGAFSEWVIRFLKQESLFDGLNRVKKQLQTMPIWKDLPEDIWSQGQVIQSSIPSWVLEGLRMLLHPFHDFFMFYTYGFIFWVGALILVSNENPNKKKVYYPNLVKITAVSAAGTLVGSILGFLPFGFGGLIGWLYHTALLMIGFSIQFNISRLRSLVLIFLPTLIGVFLMILVIGLMVGVVIAIVSSLFQ